MVYKSHQKNDKEMADDQRGGLDARGCADYADGRGGYVIGPAASMDSSGDFRGKERD